jgi:hypothetical protein
MSASLKPAEPGTLKRVTNAAVIMAAEKVSDLMRR